MRRVRCHEARERRRLLILLIGHESVSYSVLLSLLEEIDFSLALAGVELADEVITRWRRGFGSFGTANTVLLQDSRVLVWMTLKPSLHLSPALGLHELKHELLRQDLVNPRPDPGWHGSHCRLEHSFI